MNKKQKTMQKNYKIYPVVEMSPARTELGGPIMAAAYENKLLDTPAHRKELALEIFRKEGMKKLFTLDEYAYDGIKITDLDDHDLSVLVKMEVYDADMHLHGNENVTAFEGGLVIAMTDGQVITHQCCGAISDYQNWVKFLTIQPTDWEEIWIGHPWLYGRVRDGIIQLSDFLDETKPPPKDEVSAIKFQFELATFKRKMEAVISFLQQLKNRIKAILIAEGSIYYNEIPEQLIDNKIFDTEFNSE